jgi:hypothetical protein
MANTNQLFESMLKRRAERLNISIEEAARVDEAAKPLSLLAAEECARLEGTTADVVLQRYYDRLKDPSYPTSECLTPDEVAEFDDLPAERQAHLLTCAPCKALSAVTQAPKEGLAKLLNTVRQGANERKKEQTTDNTFEGKPARANPYFSAARVILSVATVAAAIRGLVHHRTQKNTRWRTDKVRP